MMQFFVGGIDLGHEVGSVTAAGKIRAGTSSRTSAVHVLLRRQRLLSNSILCLKSMWHHTCVIKEIEN